MCRLSSRICYLIIMFLKSVISLSPPRLFLGFYQADTPGRKFYFKTGITFSLFKRFDFVKIATNIYHKNMRSIDTINLLIESRKRVIRDRESIL